MSLVEEILAEYKEVDKTYRRVRGRWESKAKRFRIESLSRIFHEGTKIDEKTFEYPFYSEIFDGSAHRKSLGFNEDTGSLISTPGFLFLIDNKGEFNRVNDDTLKDPSIQRVRYLLDYDSVELDSNFELSIERLYKLSQILTKKDSTKIGYCGKEFHERLSRPYHIQLLDLVEDTMVNGNKINENTYFYEGPYCLFVPEERNKANLDFYGRENHYNSYTLELVCENTIVSLRELNNVYKDISGIVITVDTKKIDCYKTGHFLKSLSRLDKVISGKQKGTITYATKCPWS